MVKRKGKRGAPYLRPLYPLTQPFAFLFTKIAKVIEDKHPLIEINFEDSSFDLHFSSTNSLAIKTTSKILKIEVPRSRFFRTILKLSIFMEREKNQG